ncbi:MAG: ATP-binding cassette domain-containing protein [Pseudomonadota bacterium]
MVALSVRNLTVGIEGAPPLLSRISFDLAAGEHVGLIGESGSGKSLTAGALCGLLRPPIATSGGSILIEGTELLGRSPRAWRRARGADVFQIFQSPGTALTPGRRIGPQLAEAARRAGAEPERVVPPALDAVHLEQKVALQFPYQLSGGMKQRALIAMALILRPRVLIADEPTTGLDVLTENDVLSAINRMAAETQSAVLFISHDLRAVKKVADRVLVLHQGRLVEDCAATALAASGAEAARRLADAALTLQS